MIRAPGGPGLFPPLQRVTITNLACRQPHESGLLLVRWSVRTLALQLVANGTVVQIHYSTVCRILQQAEIKPHRTLYWKRSNDVAFKEKAKHVLWYYERIESLQLKGERVFCLDEKPGIQLLGRPKPDLPAQPGCPLRREYEYIRRGTGLIRMAYDLHDGSFYCDTTPGKTSENFIQMVERHAARYPGARRLHYVLDNDSTHKSALTKEWLGRMKGRVRFHFTPTGSSWLNQAEIALSVFSRRYLRDRVWNTPGNFPRFVRHATRDYNRNHAHPFRWSFTRNRFAEWQRSKTCATGH